MPDPNRRPHRYLLTFLAVFLLPPQASAGDDLWAGTKAAPGDGSSALQFRTGEGSIPAPVNPGPIADGGSDPPASEETASDGTQESQEPIPPDAVPAETLVQPEDTKVIEEGGGEPKPPGVAPEEPESYDVPIELNEKVRAYLALFAGERRDRIQEAFDRAGRYLPMMRAIFQEHGLPRDLVNMAYIESAFKVQAYSRARAVGIWQFMAGTGRKYGLRIDWWLDERRDPEKATRAAAAYLRDLYGMFEDWTLAVAAYNAGEGKVGGAIRRQKTNDFWRLRLPQETRLHVPAFMAMTILAKDPARYGFVPPTEETVPTELLSLPEPLDLRIVAQAAGIPVQNLQTLNPELNHLVTPPHAPDYPLRVPVGAADEFAKRFSEIKKTRRVSWQRHVIRRGETLSHIAHRYDTSVQVLLDLNRLPRRHLLRVGRSLVVPLMHLAPAEENGPTPRPRRRQASAPRIYVVKRGDSLWRIAETFEVSTEELQRWNDLDGSVIHPGRRLRIQPE